MLAWSADEAGARIADYVHAGDAEYAVEQANAEPALGMHEALRDFGHAMAVFDHRSLLFLVGLKRGFDPRTSDQFLRQHIGAGEAWCRSPRAA